MKCNYWVALGFCAAWTLLWKSRRNSWLTIIIIEHIPPLWAQLTSIPQMMSPPSQLKSPPSYNCRPLHINCDPLHLRIAVPTISIAPPPSHNCRLLYLNCSPIHLTITVPSLSQLPTLHLNSRPLRLTNAVHVDIQNKVVILFVGSFCTGNVENTPSP